MVELNRKVRKRIRWRKLDNSAKIFPIISNKKFSTVFRVSAVLTEKIEQEILQVAVENALSKFVSYKVKLRKGFFWYFLEHNAKTPIVEEEHNYPCKYIDQNTNNHYLFKVTYFDKKINLDVIHSLTDGTNAIKFLKEILYHYIELLHNDEFPNSYINTERIIRNNNEDSYLKNYDKKIRGKRSNKKAYAIKGTKLPFYAVGAIHGFISASKLKELCKSKNCTMTQYLTSVLTYAIYKENFSHNLSKKPIKICIPVNLKKYFRSETLSNFFSYINTEIDMNKKEYDNLDNIIKIIKEQFEKNLKEEEIIKTMSSNIRIGTNIFIRLLPLFIKKFTVKISYMEIRKYTTTSLSNVGGISLLPEYKKYVDSLFLSLAPEQVEKIKCAACSYEDKLVVTFTSILKETKIEQAFFNILRNEGLEVKIESSGVNDVIS